jgi:NAD(P)-dependent dehydrogenase (short-subunit alcohol dehydrogenase family)
MDERVAVVTGGASGLGEAIVHGFAQAGAKVLIADRNVAGAEKLASIYAANEALGCGVDVADSASINALAELAVERFGRVDVLVNSAGISGRYPAESFPEEVWDSIIRVNLKGTFMSCQAFGRIMLKQGRGSIINMASIAALAGYPFTTAYAQSKGGIAQLTRSLAVEWIARGVRVNALAPSIFETPLLKAAETAAQAHSNTSWVMTRTPIGRYGQPSEIVGPALFLASDASLMVTGHILAVDGGYLAA